MPHDNLTASEALDAIAASARELAKAHRSLAEFVPGAEANRVERVLEFEVEQLQGAVAVLRKTLGDVKAADLAGARAAAAAGIPGGIAPGVVRQPAEATA